MGASFLSFAEIFEMLVNIIIVILRQKKKNKIKNENENESDNKMNSI
jgi:hypothetical protein